MLGPSLRIRKKFEYSPWGDECSEFRKFIVILVWRVNRRIGVQGEVDIIREKIIAKEKEKILCSKELQSYREENNRIKQECDRIKQV